MSGQYAAAEVAARIPSATPTTGGMVAVTIYMPPEVAARVADACDASNAHPVVAIETHVAAWFAADVAVPTPWREVMTEQRAELAALRRQVDALTRAGLRVQS